MSEILYLCGTEFADSSLQFRPQLGEIRVPEMGRLFGETDSANIPQPFPYLVPWTRQLRINNAEYCILILPQSSGRFVTRTSTKRFNATGQGQTEEEALKDIEEAIKLLIEEENSPSGDTSWPEDFR